MLVNTAHSISEALSHGLHWLRVGGIKQPSRVGDVLVAPAPVLTVYKNPLNRVLFSTMRDANPFFHVMEALWMLAGRKDLPWLTQFNARFAGYSDDGGQTQPGAYGFRWRQHFGYDQLETIIQELKNNPLTRRCVLAMWDGGQCYDFQDNNEPNSDLCSAISGSNDVPCNTHAYFDTIDGKLNMTVCCRSNDIIWGAYGANAVHFSFLLEYVAACTGIPMGVYRQFSNNFHLYTNIVAEDQLMPMAREVEASDRYYAGEYASRKLVKGLQQVPLVDDPESFGTQLMHWFDDGVSYNGSEAFLATVATPMLAAWQAHKAKDYHAARSHAEQIKADDWRIAALEWLERRRINHEQNRQRFTDSVKEA